MRTYTNEQKEIFLKEFCTQMEENPKKTIIKIAEEIAKKYNGNTRSIKNMYYNDFAHIINPDRVKEKKENPIKQELNVVSTSGLNTLEIRLLEKLIVKMSEEDKFLIIEKLLENG